MLFILIELDFLISCFLPVRHLIQVVSAGGDVIMDGRKVGSTLQMASFKL